MTNKQLLEELRKLQQQIDELKARPPMLVPYSIPYNPPLAPLPMYPAPANPYIVWCGGTGIGTAAINGGVCS